MSSKAVPSVKVTVEYMARKLFSTSADNHFYMFNHLQFLSNVQARMKVILELCNASDLFQSRPELDAELRKL